MDKAADNISYLVAPSIYDKYKDRLTEGEVQENVRYGIRVAIFNITPIILALLLQLNNIKIYLIWLAIFVTHNWFNKKAHFKNEKICFIYTMFMLVVIPIIIKEAIK